MGKRSENFSSKGGKWWGSVKMGRLPSRFFSGRCPMVETMTLLALKPCSLFRDVFSLMVQLTKTGFEESTGSLTNVPGVWEMVCNILGWH